MQASFDSPPDFLLVVHCYYDPFLYCTDTQQEIGWKAPISATPHVIVASAGVTGLEFHQDRSRIKAYSPRRRTEVDRSSRSNTSYNIGVWWRDVTSALHSCALLTCNKNDTHALDFVLSSRTTGIAFSCQSSIVSGSEIFSWKKLMFV